MEHHRIAKTKINSAKDLCQGAVKSKMNSFRPNSNNLLENLSVPHYLFKKEMKRKERKGKEKINNFIHIYYCNDFSAK